MKDSEEGTTAGVTASLHGVPTSLSAPALLDSRGGSHRGVRGAASRALGSRARGPRGAAVTPAAADQEAEEWHYNRETEGDGGSENHSPEEGEQLWE